MTRSGHGTYREHALAFLGGDQPRSWPMNALQVTSVVGAIAFSQVMFQIGRNTPDETLPGAMPEAAIAEFIIA
jgi:hypothetical protein